MASKVPSVVFNNGKKVPILGLGTFNSPAGQVAQAVKDAIDIGYRHFDGAHIYGNEREVGEGIAAKIAEGVVKREDLFITSKLWNTFLRPDLVRGAAETTLKNLGLDYVDLYLIHWPMGFKEGGELIPKDASDKILYSDADYVDSWKELEKLVDDGLVKSIGISNFNQQQTERILAVARIPPVTNQVECHPYFNQSKLAAFLKTKNIVITAYSPLGAPARTFAKPEEPVLLEDPKLVAIAQKYSKTPAQILIRYQIQRGVIVIPKSVTKARIESNFDVFGFELTPEDFAVVDGLDRNERFITLSEMSDHPHYPFKKDEV